MDTSLTAAKTKTHAHIIKIIRLTMLERFFFFSLTSKAKSASSGSVSGEADVIKSSSSSVFKLLIKISNHHQAFPANWPGLSFETLAAVKDKIGDMPLVLHGGTGIPADMIQKAISLGVSKINVNTECQLSFADATRKYIEAGKDLEGKGFDPRKLLAPGCEAIKETVREKINLFGSAGKA